MAKLSNAITIFGTFSVFERQLSAESLASSREVLTSDETRIMTENILCSQISSTIRMCAPCIVRVTINGLMMSEFIPNFADQVSSVSRLSAAIFLRENPSSSGHRLEDMKTPLTINRVRVYSRIIRFRPFFLGENPSSSGNNVRRDHHHLEDMKTPPTISRQLRTRHAPRHRHPTAPLLVKEGTRAAAIVHSQPPARRGNIVSLSSAIGERFFGDCHPSQRNARRDVA